MIVSQAEPGASAAATAPEAAKSRSWWATVPGMLTAAAGLISAVTGLIVAIQQIRPGHAPAAPAAATQSQPPASGAATTTASGLTTTSAAETQAQPSTRADTTQAPPTRVTFTAGRQVDIANLRYDLLGASIRPGNPGQVTLSLRIRLTNTGVYDANFWNQTFRLKTTAETSAPTNFLDDLVHGGTTDTAEVDFALPAATRTAQLLIGDDPQHAIPLPIVLRRGPS